MSRRRPNRGSKPQAAANPLTLLGAGPSVTLIAVLALLRTLPKMIARSSSGPAKGIAPTAAPSQIGSNPPAPTGTPGSPRRIAKRDGGGQNPTGCLSKSQSTCTDVVTTVPIAFGVPMNGTSQ